MNNVSIYGILTTKQFVADTQSSFASYIRQLVSPKSDFCLLHLPFGVFHLRIFESISKGKSTSIISGRKFMSEQCNFCLFSDPHKTHRVDRT